MSKVTFPGAVGDGPRRLSQRAQARRRDPPPGATAERSLLGRHVGHANPGQSVAGLRPAVQKGPILLKIAGFLFTCFFETLNNLDLGKMVGNLLRVGEGEGDHRADDLRFSVRLSTLWPPTLEALLLAGAVKRPGESQVEGRSRKMLDIQDAVAVLV